MDDIINSISGIIPPKYQSLIAFSLILGRVIQAIRTGGGLKGILSSIWLGTNVPKTPNTNLQTPNTKDQTTLPLLLIGALLVCGVPTLTGCKSTPAVTVVYHTLADTQIAVDRALRVYGSMCAAGKVTPQDQAVVDNAHAQYRVAFRVAVATASVNYKSLTPDDVQRLANNVLKLISKL